MFGHKALEVLAGATPSFGSCTLKLVINGPAPGQPLPDLFQMFSGCGLWSFVSVDFVGSATGTLADGSASQMQVAQTGLIATAGKANSNSRVALDAFPAEHILIKPLAQ